MVNSHVHDIFNMKLFRNFCFCKYDKDMYVRVCMYEYVCMHIVWMNSLIEVISVVRCVRGWVCHQLLGPAMMTFAPLLTQMFSKYSCLYVCLPFDMCAHRWLMHSCVWWLSICRDRWVTDCRQMVCFFSSLTCDGVIRTVYLCSR